MKTKFGSDVKKNKEQIVIKNLEQLNSFGYDDMDETHVYQSSFRTTQCFTENGRRKRLQIHKSLTHY